MWEGQLTSRQRLSMLLVIALLAIVIRLGFQQLMLDMGGEFHNGSDSGKYISRGLGVLEHGASGYVDDSGEFVRPMSRMPVYPWFVAGAFATFGPDNLRAVVSVQAAVDGLTGLLIGVAAWAIKRRWTVPAAALAAVWPNLISHAAWVLSDTLFVSFFTAGLASVLWALKSERWRIALLVIAGSMFGIGLMTRPVLVFFPAPLFVLSAIGLRSYGGVRWRSALLLAAFPVITMLAVVSPRVIDSYQQYGQPVISTQSGTHALKWVIPCLKTPWSCRSMAEEWDRNRPIVEQRLAALPPEIRENPVVVDGIRRQLALERLREISLSQIAEGMFTGAFKNLVQSSLYGITYQLEQPDSFLSAMPGDGIADRLANFVDYNIANPMMWIFVLGQILLGVTRLIQLGGLFGGLADRSRWSVALLFAGILAYFLVINGPVGGAKYRLPMEPVLILLTVWGVEFAQAIFNKRFRPARDRRTGDG